jgi:LacI family transcriptional regulator
MVTMQDIASELKLSRATVCYALGERWREKGIAPRTRRAVLERSRALGYRRNRIASSLTTRRTRTIGVVAPVMDVLYGDMLQGIESVVGQGYALVVGISQYEGPRERGLLESFQERMVDGLIIVHANRPENRGILKRLLAGGMRIVQADRYFEDLPTDAVTADGAGLARLLTEHLLELGHRRIAYLPARHEHQGTLARQAGYAAAMGERGLAATIWSGGGKVEWGGPRFGYERSLAALRSGERPTAVVSHDEGGALGCIRAAAELGLACPADISVAGVDRDYDRRLGNPLMRFEPTRAVWDVREMGRRAAGMLLERLEGEAEDGPRHEVICGRLEVGGSTRSMMNDE